MSWRMTRNSILAVCAAGAAIAMSGCGSSSNANVVTVSVTPSAVTVVAGQVQNFSATVGGSATLTVVWTCTFVYTPLPTTATPNPVPTKAAPCTSGQTVNGGSIGTWTTSSTNGSNVLTYTSPSLSSFPNPIPVLSFIATADADKKKTGTGQVGLDSGIRVSITPLTATVPVGITPKQTASFNASLLNTNPSTAVFKLVQPNTASKNNLDTFANPLSDSCDPTCGSIDVNGTFTAPDTLPTTTTPTGGASPTSVSVVVSSSADPTHFAVGTITLVNAITNPVSYSGLYPPTVAAGGILQDVFLNAKNLLNTTQIVFVPPTAATDLKATSGLPLSSTQIFTIPISSSYCTPTTSTTTTTTAVDCDASIMTRVRLQPAQLAAAEPDPDHPAWIMMPSIPGTPPASVPDQCVVVPQGSPVAIACKLHIVNANPALVASVPDSFPRVSGTGTVSLGVNGGYFGSTGSLVNLTFNDQGTIVPTGGPRQIVGTEDNVQIPSPGLYEVTVKSSATQGAPPMFPTATTNVAVQPNFASFTPNPNNTPSATCVSPSDATKQLPGTFPLCVALLGGGNPAPSAIALNSVGQYAVIAEQGTSALQLVDLSTGTPVQAPVGPVPLAAVSATPPAPTDIAIDNQLSVNGGDLAAIVGSADSTLYLYSITPQLASPFKFVKKISLDLRTLLGQPNATGLHTPYSVGVDPGTHLGVVAYSSTNIGFIVDVNPNLDNSDTHACFLAGQIPPCPRFDQHRPDASGGHAAPGSPRVRDAGRGIWLHVGCGSLAAGDQRPDPPALIHRAEWR